MNAVSSGYSKQGLCYIKSDQSKLFVCCNLLHYSNSSYETHGPLKDGIPILKALLASKLWSNINK